MARQRSTTQPDIAQQLEGLVRIVALGTRTELLSLADFRAMVRALFRPVFGRTWLAFSSGRACLHGNLPAWCRAPSATAELAITGATAPWALAWSAPHPVPAGWKVAEAALAAGHWDSSRPSLHASHQQRQVAAGHGGSRGHAGQHRGKKCRGGRQTGTRPVAPRNAVHPVNTEN